jgi:hypothetical protein
MQIISCILRFVQLLVKTSTTEEQMFQWKKKNGEYVVNRSWVMTEAWVIVNRFKKMGAKKPLGEAMKLAWWEASMEVSVQRSAAVRSASIKDLAKLGRTRLNDMANNIHNIDRQSSADRQELADIQAAMFYA